MDKNSIAFIIILGLSVGIYIYISRLQIKVQSLESQVLVLNARVMTKENSLTDCREAVSKQSKDIELLELNEKLAIEKLKKWKKLPAEIKYKNIIKIREVKSDECKDVENVLDSAKYLDFNSL